jgi:itaconate CoA-transferase
LRDHPSLLGRNRWAPVHIPGGAIEALRPPAVFDGFDARMGPVPSVGQHTDAVRREFGLAPSQQSGTDPAPIQHQDSNRPKEQPGERHNQR